MTAFSVVFRTVLIAAERDFTSAHLNPRTIHRFNEPTARQRDDPLRFRVFMPCADPADGLNSDHETHAAACFGALPLRISWGPHRLQLEFGHRTLRQPADAVAVRP